MTEPTREQQLHQIISELFQIIDKATLNIATWPQVDALKARYQELQQEEGIWYQDDWSSSEKQEITDRPDIPPDGWSDKLSMRGY